MDNRIYKKFQCNVNHELIERIRNVRKAKADTRTADTIDKTGIDPATDRLDRDSPRGEDPTLFDTRTTVRPIDQADDPQTRKRKGNPTP